MLQLTVAGNIGKDAELKEINGQLCISFSVAINDNYTNAQGDKVEKTTWIQCSQWKPKGSKTGIVQWLKKGSKVIVQGKPAINTYRDNLNNFKAALQVRVETIELLSSTAEKPQNNGAPVHQPEPAGITEPMDDLPF